nr:hypothetical protein [Mesorhizobium sp.]
MLVANKTGHAWRGSPEAAEQFGVHHMGAKRNVDVGKMSFEVLEYADASGVHYLPVMDDTV